MPFYTVLDRFPGVRVALWRLAEDSETLCGFFPEKSKGVCEKAVGGITAEKRRRERLAARLLLLRLGQTGDIVYDRHGKTGIFDESVHISISHTQGWVVVAVADRPVGIDIETWGKRALKVSERFLGMEEREMLKCDVPDDVATLLWSAKESMFKILGIEGVDFARHLSISPFRYTPSSGEARCFEAEEFRSGQNRHFRIYYICLPDFVLTLAVE